MNKPDILDRLVWLKNGKELDFNDDEVKANFELKEVGAIYSLVLKKPQFEDEGDYTVKVRDTDVSSTAKLTVEGEFQVFIILKLFEFKFDIPFYKKQRHL
jgi:hypothetical protein